MTQKIWIAVLILLANVACQTFDGARTARNPAKTAGQLIEQRNN
jgi:hypothetical protein